MHSRVNEFLQVQDISINWPEGDLMKTITARYASGKMKHTATNGEHTVESDTLVEEGGENLAPTPHDLLAMSLATCTSITTRMYALRKEWPLENTITNVDIDKTKDETVFKVSLRFEGFLTQEQKLRLLEIANHCPVHKILKGEINILTELL
jgi:putative redox protein